MNVDDLFINTKEAVEQATSQLRNNQIWVLNPHVCDECGAEWTPRRSLWSRWPPLNLCGNAQTTTADNATTAKSSGLTDKPTDGSNL